MGKNYGYAHNLTIMVIIEVESTNIKISWNNSKNDMKVIIIKYIYANM